MSNRLPQIREQLPEFIRDDYPTFVAFIEAYYEYLSTTNNGKILQYKDIDSTVDTFIDQFRQDFAVNIPKFANIDEKTFLRNAKMFYTSRGSEASYKLLFRMMFGKEVTLSYPQEVMLKTSDGRWQQEVSFLLDTTGYIIDAFSLAGNALLVDNRVNVEAVRVRLVTADLYEIFIKSTFYGDFAPGNSIKLNGTIAGVIATTTTSFTVVSSTSGFYQGQVFAVPPETGGLSNGLKVRVSKITNDGVALKADLVTVGHGYTGDFYIAANTGDVDATHSATLPTADIVIKANVGALNRYPGFYTASNGFLSDNQKLQDNLYYQVFSYVLKIDETISAYKDTVKNILHPAGMAMFGEYQIYDEFDLSVAVELLNRFIQLDFNDDLLTSDVVTKFLICDVGVDSIGTSDTLWKIVDKYLTTDTVTPSDYGSLSQILTGDYVLSNAYFATNYTTGSGGLTRNW